jgi:hypothetical protein
MAFVNLSLLLGTLLVGLPIVLHLVMRQKPKQLVFPAIRFIQKRQETNRRSLRLRHLLLLLLRCLVVVLAALALARPSVSSGLFGNWLIIGALMLLLALISLLLLAGLFTGQGKFMLIVLGGLAAAVSAALVTMLVGTLRESSGTLIGDREAPVAAVMIFDSSPRMRYRHENLTRLEQAQEMADWMIGQLPPESRVAVLDSRGITPVFSLDLGAARKTVQRVRSTGAPRPLDRLIETALQLVRESSLKRKEIYIYTDLTEAAWTIDDTGRLQEKLTDAADVALYLIDVGIPQPINFALGEIALSSQTLTKNSKLSIKTSISCIGSGGQRSIELLLEDLDPKLPIVRDDEVIVPDSRLHSRQEVTLPENGSQALEFSVSSLDLGTRHATIRITGQDALPIDNARYVSVNVKLPWQILVVAPPDVNTSAFVEAIAPLDFRVANRAVYACEVSTPEEIPGQSLSDFAAVVLLDPTPLPATTWEQLGTYVREGGQMALFLGHHAGDGSSFNIAEAAELLPAKLRRQYRVSGRDVYLAPHSYDHPIMREFQPYATSVPWDQFPVFRYWNLQQLATDTQVILRYGSNRPALLERTVGPGTVLTMTTPITEPERPPGRQAWNELAGPNDWPRFQLVNELMRYLTQHDAGQYNFRTGQSVVLANASDDAPSRYLLFLPDGETQPVQARDGRLTINTTDMPGTYRLKGEQAGPAAGGFSVNLPARASLLDRTSPERLDELIGEDRYQLARNRDEIQREQGQQRAGREFFPLLMTILAVALILEQLLANRFYRDTDTSSA